MFVRLKSLTCVVLMATAVGCGKEKQKEVRAGDGAANPTSLADEWVSACGETDIIGQSRQVRLTINEDDERMQWTTTYYREFDCKKPMAEVVEVIQYETKQDRKKKTLMIDMNHVSATMVAASQEGAKYLNSISADGACGLEWEPGKVQQITELAGPLTCYPLKYPRQTFDVYSFEDGRLFFGKTYEDIDMSSEESRPQSVNREFFFERQ